MIKKTTFFEEDNGSQSSMRLMCFISLVTAIIISFTSMFVKLPNDINYMITLFVVSAFAPKAVQKFAETKTT